MNRARGFTLVELLLAMVLSTVILAGLWTAMRVHVRMFQGGHREVESAQLARALLRRIAADLHNTIPPQPPATQPASSTTSTSTTSTAAGPAHLKGTAQWLQIDVEPAGAAQVPAMVTYFVRDESLRENRPAVGEELLDAELGLVRRALSAVYRDQLSAQGRRPGANRASESGDLPPSLPVGGATARDDATPSPDVLLATEVQRIEFRYFDGAAWTDRWDSAASGGLPQLVAIALAFHEPASAQPTHAEATAEPTTVGDPALLELRRESLFERPVEPRKFAVYQLNVPLLAGALNKPPREDASPAPASDSGLPASNTSPAANNPTPSTAGAMP